MMHSMVRRRAASSAFRLLTQAGPRRFRDDVQQAASFTQQRQTSLVSTQRKELSSMAVAYDEDNNDSPRNDKNDSTSQLDADHKHCATCTCEDHVVPQNAEKLPPPLPKPTYSVFKRVLPSSLTALSSKKGRRYLMEALEQNMAESYWALSEHFINQSDPAYCGVTTLIMVLNAMSVDPLVRWRGGWRYFGSEDVLLSKCCISSERVQRVGITVSEFALLAKCQGVGVTLRQPPDETLHQFRKDITQLVRGPTNNDEVGRGILVVSFARSALGQTGEGHFSPIAAYHKDTDSVLLLDVARFKYAPYWVSVKDLYEAMKPLDPATDKPRGWFLMKPPRISHAEVTDEQRRPVEVVPESGDGDICPVGKIKVEYCVAREDTKQPKV